MRILILCTCRRTTVEEARKRDGTQESILISLAHIDLRKEDGKKL